MSKQVRRRARVKLLFEAKSEKFISYYKWLVILATIAMIVI